MKISEKKWHETEIGRILTFFPGEMNKILSHATPQIIIRAQQFLPLILWRWYFLRSEIENLSPYLYLEWRQEVETWPKDGQFIPRAIISIPKKSKPTITADVTVDYIDFDEQPLLKDVHNLIKGKPQFYEFDQKYKIETKAMSKNFLDLSLEKISSYEIIEAYLTYCFFSWREEDKDIKKCLSMSEWLEFWQNTFRKIYVAGEKEYGGDKLIDSFILLMRLKIEDYGVLTSELKEAERNEEKERLGHWAIFWYDFCYFFLVPFSLYLTMVAPYFGDRKNFDLDIREILNNYYDEPTPLYSAINSLKFTSFGKNFFRDFKFKKIYATNDIKIN